MKTIKQELLGEFTGTLVLVFLGCGTVALAEIYHILTALWQVAICWGLAVTLSIFLVRNRCSAHLNPAVSFTFFIQQKINRSELLFYIAAQFLGAFCAAALLYLLIQNDVASFELQNQITRGESSSMKTAMVFGEYFPNPAFPKLTVSWQKAALLEGAGTFILCFLILVLVSIKKLNRNILPIMIGGIVSLIILFLAPYTQAGINPARDLAPRLFSYFAGWDSVVFQSPAHSFFTVYILSPLLGGLFSVWNFRLIQKYNLLKFGSSLPHV